MPLTCPVCEDRPFTNKEALLQHVKSSGAWHPLCEKCDRRFTSQGALDAHMEAKHPYDCAKCDRRYHALFALEDHYRGSNLHPNCRRCGRGFKDEEACEAHLQSTHKKVPCDQCNGRQVYEEEIEIHYRDSSNHPSCTECHLGFKDAEGYKLHRETIHTQTISSPPTTSDTFEPKRSNEQLPMSTALVPMTGFLAARTIGRERTPDLRLRPGFTSPISQESAPFSPMPGQGVNMTGLWSPIGVELPLSSPYPRPPRRAIKPTPPPPRGLPTSTSITPQIPPPRSLIKFDPRLFPGSARYVPNSVDTPIPSSSSSDKGWGFSKSYAGAVVSSTGGSSSMTIPNYPSDVSRVGQMMGFGSRQRAGNSAISTLSTASRGTLTYNAPPESVCESPRSPQVTSPMGFDSIPTISPLVSSPVEIPGLATLTYSPTMESPATVVNDFTSFEDKADCSPQQSHISPSPSPSPTPSPPPRSRPTTSHDAEIEDIIKTPPAIHATPAAMGRTTSTTSTVSTSWHKNPLHCRQCERDYCDDITTTMCGHLFCNRCITAAVVKDSRCPVCQTPTLLYCLFRLDLAA